MARKLTFKEFLRRLFAKFPSIEPRGPYISSSKRIAVHCNVCGHDWTPLAGSLISGHGCPVCMGSAQISEEDFLRKLAAKRDDVELVGPYEKATKKTDFRFRACGHVCKMTPSKIISGRGCSKCADGLRGASLRFSLEDFEKVMKGIDPNLRLADGAVYKNNTTPVALHCESCGQDLWISLKQLKRSNGCRNCHHRSTSFVEQFVRHSFIQALGEDAVLSRDKTAIGMELDIFVPSLRFAVEPGSWYYHQGHVERDIAKKEACTGKGIRLVTVYDHFPPGNGAPFDGCVVSPFDLSARMNRMKLRNVVVNLLETAGHPCSFEEKDWDEIERRALADSRKMTTEDFKKELAGINPDIEFIDEYTRALDKKRFRCRVCGYEWVTVPSSVRLGSGCQRCAGNTKMSVDEFIRKLAEANPDVVLVKKGSFSNTHAATLFRCRRCGYEWSTQPYHLIADLNRTGCPACHGRKRWTHEEFIAAVAERSPRVRVLGHFLSRHTPVEVECLDCGRTWSPLPKNLLRGQGCRSCKLKEAARKRGRMVQCIDTGAIYASIADAARATNTNISSILNCCIGKSRTAGGKRWRYWDGAMN
jgi:rubrerythrin